MANLTLNIYGENDEIVKTYETAHIRWKLFKDAIALNEKVKGKGEFEQFEAISDFMKAVFIGITDDELEMADAFDIFNTFNMIIKKANSITAVKNA